jgi:hypothetical protein
MKMLLDENLPHKLLKTLPGHEVYTLQKMGWLGYKNGALIKLMVDSGFNALITFDKNIQHQQNFSKYPITVFVLIAEKNTYKDLAPLMPKVEEHLIKGLNPGSIIIM